MRRACQQQRHIMIDINGLTFAYTDKTPIFHDFSWHVTAGESWAVIGPSGCGKSTLLYLIAGLLRPRQGHIRVARENVPRKAHRGRTGLILQDYGLLPWATIRENVALGLRIQRFYKQSRWQDKPDKVTQQVERWLQRLGISEVSSHYPNQVSGGQRQRAAIARTLALQPDVLLMDEPFSSLDALTRENLQRLTLELWQETQLTTVLVTHNIEEAIYIGQHILVLHNGINSKPLVFANSDAGQTNYRREAHFLAQCNALRRILQEQQHETA